MAEQDPDLTDDLVDEGDAPPEGKRSLLAKIKVLLFITVIIAVECVVAYLYLPSSAETAAMAQATFDGASDDEEAELEAIDEELANQLEVDLGEFSVSAFQPASNNTLRIDFHLFGTVGEEDEAEFLTLMDYNLHRFREQVGVIVRSADVTDLTDAGLSLVKRKILEKTNQILGKPLLKAVIFSEFSFMEQ